MWSGPDFADMGRDTLTAWSAPTIQRYLTGTPS